LKARKPEAVPSAASLPKPLQWGRAVEGAETKTRCSKTSMRSGLQWGRAVEGAET